MPIEIPDVPEPPKLYGDGDGATVAQRGRTPMIHMASYLSATVTLRHSRPTDLDAVRAVLQRDSDLAQRLNLRRGPRAEAADGRPQPAAPVAPAPPAQPTAPTAASFDVQAAHAALKAGSKSDFVRCRSCIPPAVHAAYNDAVRRFLHDGTAPPAELTAPGAPLQDFDAVADLAQREGAAFRRRLFELTLKCSQCAANRGDARRAQEAGGDDRGAAHVCDTANAILPCVMRGAVARLTAKRDASGGVSDGIAWSAVTTAATVAASQRGALLSLEAPAVRQRIASIAAPSDATALGVAPPIDGKRVAALAPALARLPPVAHGDTTLVAPTHPIYGTKPGSNPESALQRAIDALPAVTAESWASPALASASGTAPDVVLPRSALVALADLAAESFQLGVALPLRKDGATVVVGKPLARCELSRRAAMTAAVKRVLRGSEAVAAGEATAAPCMKVVVAFSVPAVAADGASGSEPVKVRTSISVDGRTADGRPVVSLTKLEYLSKGYNSTPDSAEAFRLEQLSRRDVTRALLTLSLLPDAELHVRRVNAYTLSLMAVEVHSLATMRALADDCFRGSKDVASIWGAVAAGLTLIRDATAGAKPGSKHYVVKPPSAKDIVVLPAADVDAAAAKAPDTLKTVRVARASVAATKAEYLPIGNWPVVDRIPFTFPFPPPSDGDGADEFGLVHVETSAAALAGQDTKPLAEYFRLCPAAQAALKGAAAK